MSNFNLYFTCSVHLNVSLLFIKIIFQFSYVFSLLTVFDDFSCIFFPIKSPWSSIHKEQQTAGRSAPLLLLFLCVFSCPVLVLTSSCEVQVFLLQLTGAHDVLLFVHGAERLNGLFVNQLPEVLKGDVLTALNTHLLQNLTQTFLILRSLKQKHTEPIRISLFVSYSGNTERARLKTDSRYISFFYFLCLLLGTSF